MATETSEVLVVGAGLVGAAVAHYCAEAGARVTVIEAGRPGGGTSSNTFAWLNANNKTPREYFDLNVAGMRAHVALRDELGSAPWLHSGGNLEWAADAAGRQELRAKVECLRRWGYRAEFLSPGQVRSDLEPDLLVNPEQVQELAYFPDENWLDPLPLVHWLLGSASRRGARLYFGRVTGIAVESGRVTGVSTDRGERFAADVVIDCCGRVADEFALLVGFKLPLANTAGLLAITAPAASSLAHIVHAPGVNLRPDGAGRVLVHSDDTDGTVDAATAPSRGLAGCTELLRRAAAVLPALEGVPLEAARVGVRPIPGDGLSAVGPIPGVDGAYLVVTHSGATLCLALGQMAATEIVAGKVAPALASFRPARFLAPSLVSRESAARN